MSGSVLYLYGFVPPGAPSPPDDLEGLEGAAVEVLTLGSFDAVVSRLPADDFRAEAVERRLADLEWVARQGSAHERVVTWFVDRTWILPARLFTLYSGPPSLERAARERESVIRSTLERFSGLYEWDVKVSYDRATLEAGLRDRDTSNGDVAKGSPGRSYLLEQARAGKVVEEAGKVARELAEELLEKLSAVAEETARVPLPRGADGVPVVLNAALLIPQANEADLRETVVAAASELEEKGVKVEFSGPWAPYRFLETESPDDPEASG